MRRLFLLFPLLLAGCATSYGPQGYSGGYSDVMTGPDTAIVRYTANGYTSVDRMVAMLSLRCAEVSLQHGYRYYVVTDIRDLGATSSFTTPGYSTTNLYGTYGYGGFSGTSYTTTTPSTTVNVYKPAAMAAIKMSNELASLKGLGMPLFGGQRMMPGDAKLIVPGARRQLGIKSR